MKLEVRDLRKVYPTRFGEKLVLDGVDFDLSMGERLGVLGRNGAGKSTLVRLISGAERPTSGSVKTDMSVSWPLAFGGAFEPELTGLDNIRFISRVHGQDLDEAIAFVEDFAELGPYLGEEVRTYSSGMKARLAFAISMIIEFDCFLIDEVGAVGDARFHHRCNQELFTKRADRAMIIISHDASYVRDHCNRFAVLNDGRLAFFDGFDEAYGFFRDSIGLEPPERDIDHELPADRRQLIEFTHTAAVMDEAFMAAVQAADWSRDEGAWEEAETGYKQALQIHPFQRSYWVQKAHMAKEQGAFTRAEIGYRTAIALGEPYDDVREHFEFVVERQGLSASDIPARPYQAVQACDAAPSAPDLALLARAAWSVSEVADDTMLHLLRTHQTCDEALAAMLRDDRFGSSHQNETQAPPPRNPAALSPWTANLATLACPHLDAGAKWQLALELEQSERVWDTLRASGAFQSWNGLEVICAVSTH